jgi:hypothetical protein
MKFTSAVSRLPWYSLCLDWGLRRVSSPATLHWIALYHRSCPMLLTACPGRWRRLAWPVGSMCQGIIADNSGDKRHLTPACRSPSLVTPNSFWQNMVNKSCRSWHVLPNQCKHELAAKLVLEWRGMAGQSLGTIRGHGWSSEQDGRTRHDHTSDGVSPVPVMWQVTSERPYVADRTSRVPSFSTDTTGSAERMTNLQTSLSKRTGPHNAHLIACVNCDRQMATTDEWVY